MIFFIIGVVAALVALAVLLLSEEGKAAAFIPGVVAVILIGVSCVSYVPTGYTGIVTTFGKVEDGTKDAGVVFKSPWQSIVKMDNRVQEMNMDLSAFSSDIQEVATSVAVGYRINQQNAMTIYKSVGKKYEDTLITPRVQETVKAVVAHYDASSLISNRDAVASQMDTKLREVLAEYNIDLQYISVTNFDFTDTFTDAVEAKGCGYEGKEFLAYQEAMLAVVELIEKEPTVEKEYDVMFSGTEHIDSPGPAPVVGYRIAAKSWEEAVQKGKFYAEMQHPAFIPFAFAGPVIEVPKEELENLETEKK